MEHSVYLHQSAWFAKCTAKLGVDNFLECVSEWNGQFLCKAFFSHVFSLKKTQLEYIDTRFYLVNKRIYEKLFSSVHFELSGQVGASIEENFLEVVSFIILFWSGSGLVAVWLYTEDMFVRYSD